MQTLLLKRVFLYGVPVLVVVAIYFYIQILEGKIDRANITISSLEKTNTELATKNAELKKTYEINMEAIESVEFEKTKLTKQVDKVKRELRGKEDDKISNGLRDTVDFVLNGLREQNEASKNTNSELSSNGSTN